MHYQPPNFAILSVRLTIPLHEDNDKKISFKEFIEGLRWLKKVRGALLIGTYWTGKLMRCVFGHLPERRVRRCGATQAKRNSY
jgi:hypothetical protein